MFHLTTKNNFIQMKNYLIFFFLIACCLFPIDAQDQKTEPQKIYLNNGYYYADQKQIRFYTGTYREYYDNGTLRLEIQIKDGLPQGSYIVYFENRKPKEIRSYNNGKLHGLWRTYDISGQLLSEAEYQNDKKHGTWRVWDELGTLRYEMIYYQGNRIGVWRMWDENGNLIDERKY